jgi:hypothetical protein
MKKQKIYSKYGRDVMANAFSEIAQKLRDILSAKSVNPAAIDDSPPAVNPEVYITLMPPKKNEIIRLETMDRMMRDIESCGFFKAEKLPALKLIIEKVGGYNNDPFSYTDCLLFEEKEALHIDTDHKVSREMVECMTHKGLAQRDPHNIIPAIYYMNFFAVSRKYQLLELKARGVQNVEIVNLGGELDCRVIAKAKRIYPLDKVPLLPLSGCDAPYCRCEYVAHED